MSGHGHVQGWLDRLQGRRILRVARPDLLLVGSILCAVWVAIGTWCVLGYRDTASMAHRAADTAVGALPDVRGGGLQLIGDDGAVRDGRASSRLRPDHPSSMAVARDDAALFAGYWRAVRALIGVGAAVTVAVAVAGMVLLRHRLRAASAQAALEGAIENIDQGLVMVDRGGRLSVCNGQFSTLLQIPAGTAVRGADLRSVLAPGRPDRGRVGTDAAAVEERFLSNGSVLEVRTRCLPDGGQVLTYTDVTERWEAEERTSFLAHHDSLTGLGNRITLQERLQDAMALAGQSGRIVAVLCLDLDRFKHVNDSMGHAMGDELLKQVADRLRHVSRASDIVTRNGGDEFIVVQTQLPDRQEAFRAAERVRNALRIPFVLDGHEITVGTSIGIALFPGETESLDDLLKHADIALYRAKSEGRGSIRFFEPAMGADARDRAELEQDLRAAVAERAFELHYQPLFASDARTVVAYEALLRWEHPMRGMVSPASFIPIAEECGLILPLGRWVLEEACRTAARWPGSPVVAVNLSPIQIQRGGVPALVEAVLRDTRLDPARLELEITEGVLIQDAEAALSTLTALKALGVKLALDDFGTGYSSLSYLSRFPFDKLKIDKSFTRGLGRSDEGEVIVEAIVALGRSLGLRVTAEGVETEAQLQFLQRCGCDQFQGFLLGPPRPGVAAPLELMHPAAEPEHVPGRATRHASGPVQAKGACARPAASSKVGVETLSRGVDRRAASRRGRTDVLAQG